MYTNEKSRKSIVLCQKYCDYKLMYVYKWKVKEEHCFMTETLWLQTNVGIQMKSQGILWIMPEILWLQTDVYKWNKPDKQ